MIDINEMTLGELFGYMMASRGVTNGDGRATAIKALVDTTRQASNELANIAESIIVDFTLGKANDYMEVLGENPGEYISNQTGEVVSVQMIP